MLSGNMVLVIIHLRSTNISVDQQGGDAMGKAVPPRVTQQSTQYTPVLPSFYVNLTQLVVKEEGASIEKPCGVSSC